MEDPHSASLFWETGNRNVAKNWISKVVSPIHRTQEDFQKQVAVQESHFYIFQPDLDTSTIYINFETLSASLSINLSVHILTEICPKELGFDFMLASTLP